MSKPTLGRIVHYVDYAGYERAAIVTSTVDDKVQLTFFGPAGSVIAAPLSVEESTDPSEPNTWHWPEREEQ